DQKCRHDHSILAFHRGIRRSACGRNKVVEAGESESEENQKIDKKLQCRRVGSTQKCTPPERAEDNSPLHSEYNCSNNTPDQWRNSCHPNLLLARCQINRKRVKGRRNLVNEKLA